MLVKFFNLKILFLIFIFISNCSKDLPLILFKEGDREDLLYKGYKVCFGDFLLENEKILGPFTQAEIKCKN